MKNAKRTVVAVVLALSMILSAATLSFIAFAKDIIETPIIPMQPTLTPKAPDIHVTTDADSIMYRSDRVNVTSNITDISDDGITALDLSFVFSNGLIYNEDIEVIGLPSDWTVSSTVTANGLTVKASGSATSSNVILTFSFTISDDPQSYLIINLDNSVLYQNGSTVTPSVKATNNEFRIETPVPHISNIGASLRINNSPALRFGMMVMKDSSFNGAFSGGEFAYSDDANVKFGMIVYEGRFSGELTHTTPGAQTQIFTTPLFDNANDIVFAYVMTNITDYQKEYTFRPFVMHRASQGDPYDYTYGDVKVRSARGVAESDLLSATDLEKIELLNKFIK